MKLFLTIILLSTSASAMAFGLNSFKHLQLQLGTWLENYDQVQASRDGNTNGFEFTPYISAGLEYEIKPQMALVPEVGWVIQRTEDDISKNQFFLRGDFVYSPLEYLRLRVGSSLMIVSYAGDGGEEVMPNGSSTEVYYIPNERKNAYNQTLDFAIEYLHKNMSVKLQNYIYAWNEDEERMTTYSLSFNYLIPIEELL